MKRLLLPGRQAPLLFWAKSSLSSSTRRNALGVSLEKGGAAAVQVRCAGGGLA